jgi:hypothetical protein
VKVTAEQVALLAGMYRNTVTGTAITLVADKESLKPETGAALVPLAAGRFAPAAGGRTYEFDAKGMLRVVVDNGTGETYERVEPAKPTPKDLEALRGTYTSDEAEVTLQVIVEGGELKVTRRPEAKITLRPLYRDVFVAQ